MKRDAWAGKYKFVYMTPELAVLSHKKLTALHKAGTGIGLIAVDEAHCVSGGCMSVVRCHTRRKVVAAKKAGLHLAQPHMPLLDRRVVQHDPLKV